MNWDAIGATAEFLGAAATVATLAYLAIQVRQSSATSRAQIRQSIADSQIHYLNHRAGDPFLRRATQKMYSGEELDSEEHYGLQVHLITHLRLFENHFAQASLGTMAADDWKAQRALLKRVLGRPAYQEAFEFNEGVWNDQFGREVEEILGEIRIASSEP